MEATEGAKVLLPKSIERLHSVFLSIDVDHSGTISVSELQDACAKLSLVITSEDVADFVGSDVNSDGELDFDEFQSFYVHKLRKVFIQIDADNSGEIDVQELREAFDTLGFQVTAREVHALLAEVDQDNNAVVDFKEFCNYFCSLPSPDLRMIVQQWASGLAVDTGADFAPPPIPPASLVLWKAIFAGGVAGVVSRTATAPLERLKLLAQTGSRVPILSTLMSMWEQSRWRGLLAGNGANCLRVFPFAGIVCLMYANTAHRFPLDTGTASLNVAGRLCVGGLAGLFATLVTHPIDVVRARLTVQDQSNKAYRGITHALMAIASEEKIRGLYKGVGPTLLAIVPFIAVQQSSYDAMKQFALNQNFQPSVSLFLICGSLAGVAAQTSVYPLEVTRRRMQVSGFSTPASVKHQSAWSMLKSLSTRQLFSGLSATYVKVIPAAAVSLLVRDAILGRLKRN